MKIIRCCFNSEYNTTIELDDNAIYKIISEDSISINGCVVKIDNLSFYLDNNLEHIDNVYLNIL